MMRPTQQWSESTIRWIGYTLVSVVTVATVISVILVARLGDAASAIEQSVLLIVFAAVLFWLFRSVPKNVTVWVLAWAAAFGSTTGLGDAIVETRTGSTSTELLEGAIAVSPADLDLWSALALNYSSWAWLSIFLLSVHFVLLFPNGQITSKRWLLLLRASNAVLLFGSIGTALYLAPWVETQFSEILGEGAVTWTAGTASFLMLLASAVSLVHLIIRYRKSEGESRQQFRWVAWALGINAVVLLSWGFFSGLEYYWVLSSAALVAIPISVGIAITKYRLYDLDVVISRTLVYGILALFTGAVYVGIAIVPWVILGSEAEANTWLGIMATVVVAVSFQPLRRRIQRVANRVVFGRRATPYEVLSTFSQGIAAVDPDVLVQVARSLVEGTTAESASIWVGQGAEAHRIASWPKAVVLEQSSSEVSAPVVHGTEVLGKVTLQVPSGQPFPVTDQRLLDQVTSGLGLALRNLQLTDDLSERVAQLRESRRRVVALQDQTRRLLERDLHDGAQQRLVALKIKMGLASSIAARDELEDVEQILGEVKDDTDLTIDSLRNLARGIYPPLLEAEGLGAALSAQLRRSPLPITVQTAGIGRYPEEFEATFYFCVLEAVQNAVKHARAKSVLVTLRQDEGMLTFEVRDDGIGFDINSVGDGHGLSNMADRLDAVEGRIHVDSRVGGGTVVKGSVPVGELVRP